MIPIMSTRDKRFLLVLAGLASSGSGFAHTSAQHHYGFIDGLVHLLSQPDHLLVLFAGVGLFVYLKRNLTAKRRSRSGEN